MTEVPLRGGRTTPGVVRVGETVRRPTTPNSPFVRALLEHLHGSGFDGAPQYLGLDEQGRETLTFLPGAVPPELDPTIPDGTLAAAARLIRRFHDATAGGRLAGEHEVVCHHDLSPCNFVFRAGEPVGIIDWSAAAPGSRLQDLGYALFLWLNLGDDGPPAVEQARRVEVFCRAYGVAAGPAVIDAILEAVAANVVRLRASGRPSDARWWDEQHAWLLRHGDRLAAPALE